MLQSVWRSVSRNFDFLIGSWTFWFSSTEACEINKREKERFAFRENPGRRKIRRGGGMKLRRQKKRSMSEVSVHPAHTDTRTHTHTQVAKEKRDYEEIQ